MGRCNGGSDHGHMRSWQTASGKSAIEFRENAWHKVPPNLSKKSLSGEHILVLWITIEFIAALHYTVGRGVGNALWWQPKISLSSAFNLSEICLPAMLLCDPKAPSRPTSLLKHLKLTTSKQKLRDVGCPGEKGRRVPYILSPSFDVKNINFKCVRTSINAFDAENTVQRNCGSRGGIGTQKPKEYPPAMDTYFGIRQMACLSMKKCEISWFVRLRDLNFCLVQMEVAADT